MSEAVLLDTHIVLWAFDGDARLSHNYRSILTSDRTLYVSAASVWEMAIKISLGKLRAFDDLTGTLRRAGYEILAVSSEHAEVVARLPLHHRDPFDRLLIAQAIVEGLPVMTADPAFRLYDVVVV